MGWRVMGRAIRAGTVYFLLLYVIGFLLGATRELLLAPRFGVVVASALEALPMLAAIFHFAPLIARRFGIPPKSGGRMLMGFSGLTLLIGAEIAMTRAMRGLSPQEWLAHFASVEGVIYAALLAAFAAMPWVRR
jgi:membrane associated rhomboid family serine protease